MLKRTALFESHQKLGARLIDFGGWEMPVQYQSIVEEHQAVRKAAGIFDISHMGEFFVSGPGAEEFLNFALTNDARKLEPGQGQYTLMCNREGGVVDDLYLYCLGRGNYLLIVNASRVEADFEWLRSLQTAFSKPSSIFLDDKSWSYGAVAAQGPAVAAFIDRAIPAEPPVSRLAKNELRMIGFEGELIYVARTGYTGEDGFEIIAPAPLMAKLWEACLTAGAADGIRACGLGARDTLRTEACYPLYGHELNESTTPIEAGLGFFVALDKEFVGRPVLAQQKAAGPVKRLVAFKMSGKSAPPRPDYLIWAAEAAQNTAPLSKATSGTQSPTLGIGIGLGYVPVEYSQPGTDIRIEIRGSRFPAVIVKKPFYKRASAQ
jgi:aminomethyltransferase